MSGETEANVSGWTTDTLRAYIERLISEHDRRFTDLMAAKDLRDGQRFDAQQLALRDALAAQEKAVNTALMNAQTAVQKAEMAAERRFEAQNEFRAQLGDQARTFLPRLEYDRAHIDLVERVDKLDKRVGDASARRSGLVEGWGYLVGALGVIFAIVGLVLALR